MWYGPQRSKCTNWKGKVEWILLSKNGNLCCLAIGQIAQMKDCFIGNLSDKKERVFILLKGICPSLKCQKWSKDYTEDWVDFGKIILFVEKTEVVDIEVLLLFISANRLTVMVFTNELMKVVGWQVEFRDAELSR